jgi:hypothetical protein
MSKLNLGDSLILNSDIVVGGGKLRRVPHLMGNLFIESGCVALTEVVEVL